MENIIFSFPQIFTNVYPSPSVHVEYIFDKKFSSVQNETLARTDVILIICAPLNISS